MAVPRKIWIYWAQGWERAPQLVQLCQQSWVQQNPGWEVISLSKDNLNSYVTLDPSYEKKNIPHVWFADIVRLHLLAEHGGVWADATTYCAEPLDEWLPSVLQSGFFAFDKPKTTLASWFLVAEKQHPLLIAWRKYAQRYWYFISETKRYWIFYLFEYLMLLNKEARSIWRHTPLVSVKNAYRVRDCLKKMQTGQVTCISFLRSDISPVHKLDWKNSSITSFLADLTKQMGSK